MYRALVLLAVLGAACGSSPTSPSDSPLRLTVTPAQTLVGSETDALFTVRLSNTGSEPITLTFSSACQVSPYVVNRSTSKIVVPSNGAWVCAAMITSLTLAGGESKAEMVHISTREQPDTHVVPPGDYAIFARVEDTKYRPQSESVPFTLR